jgi:S1-C subfamily serine protease
MNAVDIILLIVVASAVISGYRAGAVPQIFAWIGVAICVVVAFLAMPLARSWLDELEPFVRGIVVIGIFLAAFALGQGLGGMVGASIRQRLGRGFLGELDQLAGALVGLAEGVLIIWLGSGLIGAIPDAAIQRQARDSTVLRQIQTSLPPASIVTGRIERLLDESGIPRLFIGLVPAPAPPAGPVPSDAEARTIARPALASTVEVQSTACGHGFVGSGFVVGPGYVVTNAHVVAGGSGIRAATESDSGDATVVTFDPQLDVALLYVPDLQAPVLRIGPRTPPTGTKAAALGHPGGGPLTVVPATVTASYPAVGRDIYGTGTVTRTVIELRAAVEHGDSGGPLMLPDGTVGGVIFGGSLTETGVGYALAPTEVAARIRDGLRSRTAVSTGACID